MTLQRPAIPQADLDMEQVRVRIDDDEILVSKPWCRGTLLIGRRMASVTARKAYASPTAATSSSSVATAMLKVSRRATRD
jgi:hypothetical protein